MAKYTVTHSCGHDVEINLVGKGTERERRMAWMRTQDCPACKTAAAQRVNTGMGLPALIGSAKQVAWAETIRAELIAQLDRVIANTYADQWIAKIRAAKPEMADTAIEAVGTYRDTFAARAEARAWIDDRDMRPEEMIREIHAAIKAAVA